MTHDNAQLRSLIQDAPLAVQRIKGWVSPREVRFLAALAYHQVAEGEVLEIGSFQGRSTVVLGKFAKLAGDCRISAVDPLVPSVHHVAGAPEPRKVFDQNLNQAGLLDFVDFHQCYSADLARDWRQPLRLLWIDGDHSYAGALTDFQSYSPYLSDGAVIALHDTINMYEGSLRVFMENVLLNPHFGDAGIVGSIGWARYWKCPANARAFQEKKLKLYRRLSRLVPYVVFDEQPTGWSRAMYRFHRNRVPRNGSSNMAWIDQAA